jgi:hypothetical protein
VPILTVGPSIKPSASLGTLRRSLSPINYRSSAGLAFQHARILAEKTGAELILINIAEPDLQKQNLDEDREALCAWVAPDLRERCAVREVVRHGNSADPSCPLSRALHCSEGSQQGVDGAAGWPAAELIIPENLSSRFPLLPHFPPSSPLRHIVERGREKRVPILIFEIFAGGEARAEHPTPQKTAFRSSPA